MDERIIVRLPSAMKGALVKASDADRRKLADYVRIVLEDHLGARGKRKRR